MRHIVMVKPEHQAGDVAGEWYLAGHHIVYLYEALNGLCVDLGSTEVGLLDDERIESWEEEFYGEGGSVFDPPLVQNNPGWGLDRISQRALPLNDTYEYISDGTGVRVYVMDSSIRNTHQQFGSRVSAGQNFVSGGSTWDADYYHGTASAGFIGASVRGAAKQVEIYPLRVMDATGAVAGSDATNAINWVVANHPPEIPAVVNVSLVWSPSTAVDDTFAKIVNEAGLLVVACAGNTSNTTVQSPARHPQILSVGNSDSGDTVYTTSSRGSQVNIFAPGAQVTSLSHSSDTGEFTGYGTSWSAAYVSGIVALLLAQNPNLTPAQLTDLVLQGGTTVQIDPNSGTNGSPDLLAYSVLEAPFSGTGTIAQTLPLCTQAASGTSVSPWQNPTSFSGIVEQSYEDTTVVTGTWYRYRVVAVDGVMESVPTGWVEVQATAPGGAIAQTLPALTQAGTGTFTAPVYTAEAVQTLPSLTQSASGTFASPQLGTIVQVLSPVTQAAAGTTTAPTFTGTATQALGTLAQAASGTHVAPISSGSASQTLPALTQAASGTVTNPPPVPSGITVSVDGTSLIYDDYEVTV